MKSSNLILAIFFLAALTGCYEKYDYTYELRINKLYVETYHNSVIDIGYKYLTDSCNFRIYVGKYDNEHGGIYIQCLRDSIFITQDFDGTDLKKVKHSLQNLKNRNDFYFWNSKCSSCR